MNKYVLIQRFYLTIMKKLKKGADQIEIADYFNDKGLFDDQKRMDIEEFKDMLKDMSLIGLKGDGWIYFKEDFDPDGEGSVGAEKFTEDFQDI